VVPSRNICFIHFLFVGVFSFIRGCRKHECTRLEINRACFYCPSRLEIIGYSNKGLWIRAFLHMLTRFRRTHWPILILKECFFTFRWFICYIQNPWYVLVPIFFTRGPDKTGKIVLLFSFLRLSLLEGSSWREINNIQKKKKENSIGLLPACR